MGTRKAKAKPLTNTEKLAKRIGPNNSRLNHNMELLSTSTTTNTPLTNSQKSARRNVTMKMAKGEPVSNAEKIAAGITVNTNSRYNQAVRNVTARLVANKAKALLNPKVVLKPAASQAEEKLLGNTKLRELRNSIFSKDNASLNAYREERKQAINRSIQMATMPKPTMPKPSMPRPSMPKPSMPKPSMPIGGNRKSRMTRRR